MKQFFAFLMSAVCLISVISCNTKMPQPDEMTDDAAGSVETTVTHKYDNNEETETADKTSDDTRQPVRIRLTVDDREAVVEMLDNDAAESFLSMLPLTLTFEDYNGIEKISSLPRKPEIGSAPTSCDPDIGSFAYYAPWGNLSVFYKDFRQSDSLIPLGTFISGIEIFAEAYGSFSVLIEAEDRI